MSVHAAAPTSAREPAIPSPGVFLQPIAPPASLGLWGFFVANSLIATWIFGWWGGPHSLSYIFVFPAALGGLVQFLAGMWSFKARDYIAAGLLSMWGTYWTAWGIVQGLGAAGALTIAPLGASQPEFAIWFIPLGLFTLTGAFSALSPTNGNLGVFGLLFTTGVGAILLCVGFWAGSMTWLEIAAGWLIAVSCFAIYVASMFMLRSAWRRVILPFGTFKREGNIPGQQIDTPLEYPAGQPGVSSRGQA